MLNPAPKGHPVGSQTTVRWQQYNNDNNDNNDNNSNDSNNGNDNSNTDKNKGEDKLVIDTSSPSSVIITIYDYYQKDETPKTGIFSFIDIFRRY